MSCFTGTKAQAGKPGGPYEAHGQSKMGHCDRRHPGPGRCASLRLRDPARKRGYPVLQRAKSGKSPPPGSTAPYRPGTNERPTSPSSPSSVRNTRPRPGPSRPTGSISPPGGASSATRRSRALRKNASSGSSRSIPETCMPSPSAPTADTWQRAGDSWHTCATMSRSISGTPKAAALIRNLPGPAGPEKIENNVTCPGLQPGQPTACRRIFPSR